MNKYQVRVKHNIHGYTDFITRILNEDEIERLNQSSTFEIVMMQKVIDGMPKLGQLVRAYDNFYGHVVSMDNDRVQIQLKSGAIYGTDIYTLIEAQ